MRVTVENTSPVERKLKVQVPAEEVQKQVDGKLREIGRTVRIKGFRPGRIPHSVLRQRYGKQVRQEVIAQAMQASLQDAISREALRPATQPRLETPPDFAGEGDLEFTAVVEVFPELGDIDVSGIELRRPVVEVSEADVDDMMLTLRRQRQDWKEVERKPAAGDQVTIEYIAETDEGRVPAEGKQRLTFVLGNTGFEALEKVAAALEPGQEADVDLSFPEAYREAALAGKDAHVEVELTSVREGVLPEVDADFIQSFGIESGEVDELRREIRGNLERELSQAVKKRLKGQLLEGLLGAHPELEVPRGLVDHDARGLRQQLSERLGEGVEAPPVEEFRDEAARRIKASLLMTELARQNKIVVDGARVRSTIEMVADTYEQPSEVMQMYYSDQRLLQSVENAVLEEQVVDWAMENAKVSDEPASFKEVIAAAGE